MNSLSEVTLLEDFSDVVDYSKHTAVAKDWTLLL